MPSARYFGLVSPNATLLRVDAPGGAGEPGRGRLMVEGEPQRSPVLLYDPGTAERVRLGDVFKDVRRMLHALVRDLPAGLEFAPGQRLVLRRESAAADAPDEVYGLVQVQRVETADRRLSNWTLALGEVRP